MHRRKRSSELKKAKVVPLAKSKDKANPTNHGPVAFLSVLSKLLAFSDAWYSLPLTVRSYHSLNSLEQNLRVHFEAVTWEGL